MTLTIGSCAIDAGGNVTGTGLSADIANAWRSALQAVVATPPPNPPKSPPAGPLQLAYLMMVSTPFLVAFADNLAAAIINQITSNAAVTVNVTTSTAGLQLTPNPNNPNTATLAPAANVPLSGTIA
jgi:hypothetical protein